MTPQPHRTDPARRVADAVLFLSSLLLSILATNQNWVIVALAALVPMLFFVQRVGIGVSFVAGALHGAIVYAVGCSWLGNYHAAALLFVIGLETFWFALAWGLVALTMRSPSRLAPLAAVLVWSAIEIARSNGFLGFPYLTLPYSMSNSTLALAAASVGGVALVGLVLALANASVYLAIRNIRASWNKRSAGGLAKAILERGLLPLSLTLALPITLAIALVAAGAPRVPPGEPGTVAVASTAPQASTRPDMVRVALIQAAASVELAEAGHTQATATGPREWAPMLRRLESQSEQALEHRPDMVAWHETAIIPPVDWYLRHRPDREVYQFVAEFKTFLDSYPVPLLVGSGYASPDDTARNTEYNSAILYERGEGAMRYDKMKLVPFTEYFPYQRLLPGLSRWIIAQFGYFWTPGARPVVFNLGGARFAAPICFEDSFGRHFASFDAPDFFVVLTNDSWAHSAFMQSQHLAMSRFRAAETGSLVLRVAETGSTAVIAPNGAIVAALPPFKPGILYVDVPLHAARTTVYEAGGKYLDVIIVALAMAMAALLLLMAVFNRLGRLNRIDKNGGV